MNDLLFTVKGQEGYSNGARGPAAYDIEAGYTTAQSEKSKDMGDFFAKVEELKQDMAEIKAKQREIQHMHERSKTIVRQKEMQQHRDEMQVCATSHSVDRLVAVCRATPGPQAAVSWRWPLLPLPLCPALC